MTTLDDWIDRFLAFAAAERGFSTRVRSTRPRCNASSPASVAAVSRRAAKRASPRRSAASAGFSSSSASSACPRPPSCRSVPACPRCRTRPDARTCVRSSTRHPSTPRSVAAIARCSSCSTAPACASPSSCACVPRTSTSTRTASAWWARAAANASSRSAGSRANGSASTRRMRARRSSFVIGLARSRMEVSAAMEDGSGASTAVSRCARSAGARDAAAMAVDARMTPAEIQRISQQFLVVGADVEHNRQRASGMNAGTE